MQNDLTKELEIKYCPICGGELAVQKLLPEVEKIIDKIIQLGEIYPVSKKEMERALNNAK